MIRCKRCNGKNVQIATWTDPNTSEVFDDYGSFDSYETTWCDDCEDHTGLRSVETPAPDDYARVTFDDFEVTLSRADRDGKVVIQIDTPEDHDIALNGMPVARVMINDAVQWEGFPDGREDPSPPEPRYANRYHADGTVTYWSVHAQQWVRAATIPDRDLATMSDAERNLIRSRREAFDRGEPL